MDVLNHNPGDLMRITTAVGSVALALALVGCQDVTAPDPSAESPPEVAISANNQRGPDNRCYGEIIAGISSTWPWAHDDKIAFEPPPGAVALWVQTFGPGLGITTVRQLQVLFCG